MSVLPIVCDNCGAKYKLPESFSGDKAKCKQCGSVIDVAAQKAAAAAPAAKPAPTRAARAAAPAADKPAADKPARAERKARGGDDAPKGRRAGRGRAAAADAAPEAGAERRGRVPRDEPKKSNTMLLVGGGVGVIAIAAVIAVFSMGKKDAPASTDQAATDAAKPAASAPAAPAKTPEPPKGAAPAPEPEKPAADADAKPDDGAPADAPAAKEPGAREPAAKTEKAADDGEPKEKWERNTTTSMADVFDPKSLGDITWPAEVDDAQKEEIRSLVTDIVDGGRPGITAKPKLVEIGYHAVFGILERLRQLNYTDTAEEVTAWELNKLLEDITVRLNAGFVAVSDGENLDPRKADHNARTNKAWASLLTTYPDKDSFEAGRKKRLSSPK